MAQMRQDGSKSNCLNLAGLLKVAWPWAILLGVVPTNAVAPYGKDDVSF